MRGRCDTPAENGKAERATLGLQGPYVWPEKWVLCGAPKSRASKDMWVCEALWGSGFGWKGWAGVNVGVPSPKDLSSLTLPSHPSGSSPFPPATS